MMAASRLLGLLLTTLGLGASSRLARPPHIVFIVADDYGWNDVGFHNPDMLTPNIDKLANQGVILNQSYIQPLCSPSRTAFMSGRYPFKAGTQHGVITPEQAVCLPLNFTLLPQELKKLGYATHMIGKWHLGFCNWNCTPTYRGFDTFFGYYNAAEDYYTHKIANYLDLRDNKEPATQYNGQYSTIQFATKAQSLISNHNQTQPLFLYLPFQAVHEPIEVPEKYEKMYPNIQNEQRRQYCGMVSAMDEAIGNITQSLQQAGMLEDTLFFFTADNGGIPFFGGNNFPLRGGKVTVWEGGTRGVGFVSGARLQKTGYTFDGMMHAVDWMPTILSAAGGEFPGDIDGVDQWSAISNDLASRRKEFVYSLDVQLPPIEGSAAIRVGDYKLIHGYPGPYSDWYPPPNVGKSPDNKEVSYEEYVGKFGAAKDQLFNVKTDPTEHHDIASSHPDIVQQLTDRLNVYRKQMVPANYPQRDPKANPQNFDDVWSPGWC